MARVATTGDEKRRLLESTGADAVEMESSVIRARCRTRGIPAATVRVISDEADEALPLDFNTLMTARGTLDFPRLVGLILCHPGAIPGLLRLGRRSAAAARSLAQVLQACCAGTPSEGRGLRVLGLSRRRGGRQLRGARSSGRGPAAPQEAGVAPIHLLQVQLHALENRHRVEPDGRDAQEAHGTARVTELARTPEERLSAPGIRPGHRPAVVGDVATLARDRLEDVGEVAAPGSLRVWHGDLQEGEMPKPDVPGAKMRAEIAKVTGALTSL